MYSYDTRVSHVLAVFTQDVFVPTLNDLHKLNLMFLMDEILIKESFFFKSKNAPKMFKLVQRV